MSSGQSQRFQAAVATIAFTPKKDSNSPSLPFRALPIIGWAAWTTWLTVTAMVEAKLDQTQMKAARMDVVRVNSIHIIFSKRPRSILN